jgi:hypothetical protein
MSTPIRKPTEQEAVAWRLANPDATFEELQAYVNGGTPLNPSRFRQLVKGFGRGAAQGATFGLADEAVGTIQGILTPGKSIGEAIAEQRQTDAGLPNGAQLAGNVAGGIASGAGLARMAMSRSGALAALLGRPAAGGVGARAAAGAASGAAGGAVGAFGAAEGNPLERMDNAGIGALLGGIAGGALPVAGAAMRAGGNAMGVRPRMVESPMLGGPERESADILNEALRQGGTTPDDIIREAQKNASVPQTLQELGPDQVGDVSRGAQSRSNQARVFSRDMQEELLEGERDRYIQRLGESLNPDDKDIVKVAAELRDLRSANASKNFPAALDKTVSDTGVASFFREKEVVRAYNEFRDNQLTRLRAGEIAEADVPPEIYRITTTENGKRRIALATTDIPLRAFHVVQQAVNDAINNGLRNGKTIPTARAKVLMSALNKHMNTVEEMVPEYGAARAVYRDDSAPMHALRAGAGKKPSAADKNFGKGVPDFSKAAAQDVKAWVNGRRAASKGDEVAASELEHYMLGAYSHLRSQLKGKASSAAFLDLPKNREKIVALFGGDPDTADDFVRALRLEQRRRPVSAVSRKGAGIQGDETISTAAMDAILAGAGTAGGRPYAATASIARLLRGEHRMSDKTAQATMERLFKGVGGVEELVAAMEDLKRAGEAQVKRRTRNFGATAGAAGGVATATGN